MQHRKENNYWCLTSRFSYNRKTWLRQANFILPKGKSSRFPGAPEYPKSIDEESRVFCRWRISWKITEQQTDRLFLVNTHHPILDALFNTKAAEATQKKISIDFEVNDLSNLPFDVSDMVVLLSNLLDNAIEACQQYDKGDKAIHVMAVAQQDFFISVRNTSEPVVIISGSIPTTKPEPQMHGFGLANIRLILEKYSGEYTMFYENGWFQFTADIPFTPISWQILSMLVQKHGRNLLLYV